MGAHARGGGSAQVARVRVIVSGRVQDVWFRDTCRQVAQGAGVNGFVRNLADGTVEAAFEGDPTAVERLVAWCSVGPRLAQVSHVARFEEPPVGDRGFVIR